MPRHPEPSRTHAHGWRVLQAVQPPLPTLIDADTRPRERLRSPGVIQPHLERDLGRVSCGPDQGAR
jgi:hypothetical protein